MTSVTSSEQSCPECAPRDTKVVLDHSSGDLVCTACGLVLEESCIDEGQEWRSFAQEGIDMGARVDARDRGADSANQVDASSGKMRLTTMSGTTAMAQDLIRAQRQAEHRVKDTVIDAEREAARTLGNAESKVRVVTSRLTLNEIVVSRCMELIETLQRKDKVLIQQQMTWYIAIVYLACREEGATRTFRELTACFADEWGKSEANFEKTIRRNVAKLQKDLASKLKKAVNSYISPAELMHRFVSRLQLHPEVSIPAVAIAERARQFDVVRPKNEREQCAIVASAIFIVSWLLDVAEKPRLVDVSIIAKVSEGVVQEAYNKIRPHTAMLLPEAFKVRLQGGVDNLPSACR